MGCWLLDMGKAPYLERYENFYLAQVNRTLSFYQEPFIALELLSYQLVDSNLVHYSPHGSPEVWLNVWGVFQASDHNTYWFWAGGNVYGECGVGCPGYWMAEPAFLEQKKLHFDQNLINNPGGLKNGNASDRPQDSGSSA